MSNNYHGEATLSLKNNSLHLKHKLSREQNLKKSVQFQYN